MQTVAPCAFKAQLNSLNCHSSQRCYRTGQAGAIKSSIHSLDCSATVPATHYRLQQAQQIYLQEQVCFAFKKEKSNKYISLDFQPTFSLNPKYAPTKVNGTDIPNHMAKIATSVPKGMAADDPFTQRIRFMMKKSAKTTLPEEIRNKTWNYHDTL